MSVWILSKRPEYENTRLLGEFETLGISATIADPTKFDLIIETGTVGVFYQNKRITLPGAVLVRTGSGTSNHMASILREFEYAGVPVINSIDSTEIAKDKVITGQLMAKHGIPIPKTMLMHIPVDVKVVENEIGFPCIIKVGTGSYGKGVHLCQSSQEFASLIHMIEALDPKRCIIIQKYIDKEVGTDLRVWVIDGKVIAAMKRKSADGDFRANISNGGVGEMYPLDDDIIDISTRAAKAVGLAIAGIDLLFGSNGYMLCEVNSSPGFSGFEKYCDTNIAKIITGYVAQKI